MMLLADDTGVIMQAMAMMQQYRAILEDAAELWQPAWVRLLTCWMYLFKPHSPCQAQRLFISISEEYATIGSFNKHVELSRSFMLCSTWSHGCTVCTYIPKLYSVLPRAVVLPLDLLVLRPGMPCRYGLVFRRFFMLVTYVPMLQVLPCTYISPAPASITLDPAKCCRQPGLETAMQK